MDFISLITHIPIAVEKKGHPSNSAGQAAKNLLVARGGTHTAPTPGVVCNH